MGPGGAFREAPGWAGGDSHMNPISSGSQTPKRRWQEPQLLSQQWPGKKGGRGARQGSGDEERWLLPRSPPAPNLGAGVLLARPVGRGGRARHGFRANGSRRPRHGPSHLPLVAARRGGGGAPRRAPRVPGVPASASGPPARGSVCKGHAPELNLSFPGRPRGS